MGKLDSLTDEKCINLSVKLYTKYKNESWILSPSQCLEKSNSWFGNEKFKIEIVNHELKSNRILFALKSGVFFLSNEYPDDKPSRKNPYNVLLVSEKKSSKLDPFIRKESIQSYFTSNDFKENIKEDDFIYKTCNTCNGSGQVTHISNTVLGQMQTASPCSYCNGNGKIIDKGPQGTDANGMVRGIINLTDPELTFLKELKKDLLNESEKVEIKNTAETLAKADKVKAEENRVKSFESKFTFQKKAIIQEFDANNNGKVDIIEDGGEYFMKILKKNQSKIIDVDKSYVQKFIRISNYLNDQKKNAQKIFEEIKKYQYGSGSADQTKSDLALKDCMLYEAALVLVQDQSASTSLIQRKLRIGYNRAGRIIDQLELAGVVGPFEGSKPRKILVRDEIELKTFSFYTSKEEGQSVSSSNEQLDLDLQNLDYLSRILKQHLQEYHILLVHSLSMLTAVTKNDLVLFYDIYETFDRLNVFDSIWQKDLSDQLTGINDNISNLISHVRSMEDNLLDGLRELSYTNEKSFDSLKTSISKELESIDSSIKFNSLLTGISTYQVYKINKNTKKHKIIP